MMQEVFTGNFTQPDPLPAEAEAAALAVMRSGRLHRYAEAPGEVCEVSLLEREFAGRHAKRYRQWEDDPLSLIPPEGEPIAEARGRIFSAVARLLRRSRAGEVAIVLHPIGLGLLRCWLTERPVVEFRSAADAPPIERYSLAPALIDRLREVAAAEVIRS